MEQKTKNEKIVWEKKTKITVLILNSVATMISAWILISNWQVLPVFFKECGGYATVLIAFVVFGWLGFFLRRRTLMQVTAITGGYILFTLRFFLFVGEFVRIILLVADI